MHRLRGCDQFKHITKDELQDHVYDNPLSDEMFNEVVDLVNSIKRDFVSIFNSVVKFSEIYDVVRTTGNDVFKLRKAITDKLNNFKISYEVCYLLFIIYMHDTYGRITTI